jgi:hypothetical protein
LSLPYLDVINACLAFLPGSFLFAAIPQKMLPNFKLHDKIFFGAIFWIYVLIGGSIIVDLIKGSISNFFAFFSVFSVFVIILSLVFIIRKRAQHLRIQIDLERLSYTPILLLVCFIFFVVIYYHSLFQEWDAIAYYIPAAKAITLSDSINLQPYYLLSFFDTSPLVPLLYSWIGTSNLFSLYNLPVAFFALTIISVFLISKEVLPNYSALICALIFVTLPITLVTLSSRSLYLDISFVLFLLSALYSALRIIGLRQLNISNKSIFPYYFIFGCSITLMCLSRIEFGIILAPSIIITTLIAFQTKYWQILSTVSLGAILCIREMRNIFLDKALWFDHIQNLVPLLVISVSFFIVLTLLTKNIENRKAINKASIILVISPTIPLLLLLVRNLTNGFIIPQLPLTNNFISKSITNFSSVFSSQTSVSTISQPGNVLAVWWWIFVPYIAPALIGGITILLLFHKRHFIEPKNCILAFFFISSIILWITLGVDLQPRRLYYFTPFCALFVAFGLKSLRNLYTRVGFIIRVSTLVTSLFVLTLMRINLSDVNDLTLFYAKFAQLPADYTFVIICLIFSTIIFLPYGQLLKVFHRKILLSKKIILPLLLLVVLINSTTVTAFVYPMISTSMKEGVATQNQFFGGLAYYPDVVDYYNANITDSGATLGFYCHELITFCNRSIIDLSDPIYGSRIYYKLNGMNESQILSTFSDLNIRYFLIPSSTSPFYSDYSQLTNKSVLRNLFSDNPSFRILYIFKYATLFVASPNFTTKDLPVYLIVPWTYSNLTSFEVCRNNTAFNISGLSDGLLSAMFELNSYESIGDSLLLKVKSYYSATLRVQLFSDLTNTSTAFTTFQYSMENETKNLVIDFSNVASSNGFDRFHIEGILVGIIDSHSDQSIFSVEQINSLDYDIVPES